MNILTNNPTPSISAISCNVCYGTADFFSFLTGEGKCRKCLSSYYGLFGAALDASLAAYSDCDFAWHLITSLNPVAIAQRCKDRFEKGILFLNEEKAEQLTFNFDRPRPAERPPTAAIQEVRTTIYRPRQPIEINVPVCQGCGREECHEYVRENGTSNIWCFDCFEEFFDIPQFYLSQSWLDQHKNELPIEVRIVNIKRK